MELSKSEEMRIEEIMNEFDFYRVHKCMVGMNWKWWNYGIPSIDDIKKEALRLLNNSISYIRYNKYGNWVCGGLCVKYTPENNLLELSFIVTEWDDSLITDTPEYINIIKKEKRKKLINSLLNE